MKKILILFLMTCFTSPLMAQTDNGWEEWQKTSCYSKIEFRLKYERKNGEQHHWKIQFKNNYSELISFNYNVTDKLQQYSITTHRKVMDANKQSDEIDVYTKEEDIYLIVDKVSFSPYPEFFVDCE